LFMTLLAAFGVVLSRYSGQTDIVIGSAIANRNRREIEGLIGFFVNTLALRLDLSEKPSFAAFLKQVQAVTQDAYEHQDLPFEMLVEELQLERKLDRNPLVQVMFALQNAANETWNLPGLTIEEMSWELEPARFDLEVHLSEVNDGIAGFCCYNIDLFDGATIIRLLEHFQNLLRAIIVNPQESVSLLPLLSEQEQKQLLVDWNQTQADYPKDKLVHQLFEAQAVSQPEAIALIFENQALTYRELNNRANQLAHYLQLLGVSQEQIVGVYFDRSLEMVIGLLGILKAGAAYLPIDPEYPSVRTQFILEDTQLSLLLTQAKLAEKLSQTQTQIICLDRNWPEIASRPQTNPDLKVESSHLAYCIYTSGSTGQPKGVLIPHQALLNLISWHQQTFQLSSLDKTTQLAGVAFDAMVWELWPSLAAGACIHLVPQNILVSPTDLRDWLLNQEITISFVPTPVAEKLLSLDWPEHSCLKTLLLGGDKLHFYPAASLPFQVINNYGPTENTVVATSGLVKSPTFDHFSAPTIGKAIANVQIYLLDQNLQPVPIGVPGELHLGGAGLARGYLNRPELTAEKFIANPFDPPLTPLDKGGEEPVVVAKENNTGDKRLVAYLVPALQNEALPEQLAQWQSEYISDWQSLYERTYSQGQDNLADLTFNITGWNSSYTRQPLPASEMREWVENTVSRILAFQPERGLEIGCGTGLLLSRVAKHCLEYWATDYSQGAINYVEQVCNAVEGLEQVKLVCQTADNFEGIPPRQFDTVVLNSIIQYFPSVDYLLQVLEGAINVIGERGQIFVGDVRSLPLLEPYHAAVQLAQASDSKTVESQ